MAPPARRLDPSKKLVPAAPVPGDVRAGLGASPKTLPCKYFYDERGSRLFERICEQPEYYLTRAELAIMEAHAPAMAAAAGAGALLVELGSGSSRKTELLLAHLPSPAAYVPVDISRSALEAAVARLSRRHPFLTIHPIGADYLTPFELPAVRRPVQRRVLYFPGSTIGNLTHDQARAFMARAAALVGERGALLVGFDLKKDRATLEAAYNDAAGVTADFNLNLLARLNREHGAAFDLGAFEHRAVWDDAHSRIEMRLVSRVRQTVDLAGHEITFEAGEAIVTEHSHKYTPADVADLGAAGGLRVTATWTDADRRFCVAWLER